MSSTANEQAAESGLPAQIPSRPHLAWLLLVCAFFWMAASAGFAGYIGKWGLLDSSSRNSIERMLDGTADRPFVYRQLVPVIARWADRIAPQEVKEYLGEKLRPELQFRKVTAIEKPELRFPYLVVYYLSFLALFASLFVLRSAALAMGVGELPAMVAPAALALAFPYLQTVGGYFYDTVELFFFALAFLFAFRGWIFPLVALALVATFNKESFLFFVPTLFPLLRAARSAVATWLALLFASAASLAVNFATKSVFQGNPGEVASYQLLRNLEHYSIASTWLQLESTYGIIGPAGAFVGTIVVVATIVSTGWGRCSDALRTHLLLAAAINLPLALAFAYTGELRNLSLLFVGFAVLSACAITPGEGRIGTCAEVSVGRSAQSQ